MRTKKPRHLHTHRFRLCCIFPCDSPFYHTTYPYIIGTPEKWVTIVDTKLQGRSLSLIPTQFRVPAVLCYALFTLQPPHVHGVRDQSFIQQDRTQRCFWPADKSLMLPLRLFTIVTYSRSTQLKAMSCKPRGT